MRGWIGVVALVASVASVARADVAPPSPVPAGELAGCGHGATGPCYRPAPCTTGADCGGEGMACTSWHVCTAHVDGREWLVSSCPPEEHCGAWDVEQQMEREWYLGPLPDADISCSDGLYCVPESSLGGRPAQAPAVTPPSGCGCRAGRGAGDAWIGAVSIGVLWLIARRARARRRP